MSTKLKNVLIIYENQDEKDIVVDALDLSRHYTSTKQFSNAFLSTYSEVITYFDAVIIMESCFSRESISRLKESEICKRIPVLVFTDSQEETLLHDAIKIGISAYIIDGLKKERVVSLLQVAEARFKQMQVSQKEILNSRRALVERKQIDKAKGLLMSNQNMDEESAYKTLRNMAMNQNKKIADVAENVIHLMTALK